MAAAQYASGSTALTADAAATVVTANPETTDGVYQFWVDGSSLSGANQYLEARVLEKINDTGDTQREAMLLTVPFGKPMTFSAVVILLFGWDFTLKLVGGSNVTIQWSIRSV